MAIYRVCYATREEVRRALDVKQADYNNTQIDRQLQEASDSVDSLCNRVPYGFFPTDTTVKIDWPNWQYTYPWKVYLDAATLTGPPTLLVSGTFLPSPVVIPSNAYILHPINYGPPFTRIELRRDLNNFFGNNTTPQLDIGITGTFGYWNKILASPTTLGAVISSTTVTSIQTTMGSGANGAPGVGDMLLIDSERMILQDAQYVSTGIATVSGLTSNPPSAADNAIAVPSGPAFTIGETLVADSEVLLVVNILGNILVVERAWDGSALATHNTGVTLFARRQWTVTRGDLGTTAATHSNGASIGYLAIPGLVKELAVAEAVVGLVQEPGGYAFSSQYNRSENVLGGTGHGQQREPMPGAGLPDLRDRCAARYGRKARSRVV